MKKPSLRRDTYPSIPRWICFCKILKDGVTFRDSIGWFVINDGQRTQKYWPKCFKCKFFDSEISWNLPNSILKLHEILIRDTLCDKTSNFSDLLSLGVSFRHDPEVPEKNNKHIRAKQFTIYNICLGEVWWIPLEFLRRNGPWGFTFFAQMGNYLISAQTGKKKLPVYA